MISSNCAALSLSEHERLLRQAALDASARKTRLRFEPILEAEFETMTRVECRSSLRRFLLYAALVQVVCVSIDAACGSSQLGIVVRLLISIPLLLLGAAVLTRPIPVRLEGLSFGIPVVVVAAGTAFIGEGLSDARCAEYLLGAVFIVFAANVAIPIRFSHALVMSIVALVAYAAIVVHGAQVVSHELTLAFTVTIVSVSLAATHRAEATRRESFLLRLREQIGAKELSQANRRLLELSQTDALTGLFNRRFFDGAADHARAESLRNGTSLAFMMIDADHFKAINDSLGHTQGDECLQRIADAIKQNIRSGDLAARYGGEEFVVILPNATAHEAAAVAERVRQAVELLRRENPDHSGFATVSIGVALLATGTNESVTDLVRSADWALYEAKSAGRNRVVSVLATAQPGRMRD